MYIIELYLKLKQDYKLKQGFFKRFNKAKNLNVQSEEENEEKCNHIFIPIDSTGKILACKNCGMIYKLKKGEVNPFK